LRPELNRIIYTEDQLDFQTIRLCDGHFIFYDIDGEEFGIRQIQPWDKKQLRGIIVIILDSRTILNRRIKNRLVRPDRQMSQSFIEEEQLLEIHTALNQAESINVPVKFIMNNNNLTNKAELLLMYVRQFIKKNLTMV